MIDDRYPELGVPINGTISSFGGPQDMGMSETEGLALYPGLGRELDPNDMYCAMRFNYNITPKEMLRNCLVLVTRYFGTDRLVVACKPVDFGPAAWTGRLIDVSPGTLKALKCKTDDTVQCLLILDAQAA